MPGDTSTIPYPDFVRNTDYVINSQGDTVFLLKNSDQSGAYSVHINLPDKEEKETPDHSNLALVIILFFVFVMLAVRKSTGPGQEEETELTPKMRKKRAEDKAAENGPVYDEWLSKYNPYYKGLSPDMRQRFLLRTIEFAQLKEFRFHEIEEKDYMLILISGAAVQMTFGLKNYLMDYFPVIHVIRKEYTLDYDNETYYGHVSRNGIYISWNHFLAGYEDYTDSVNVGLHEMAHAVSYDVFLGMQDRHDRKFKQRLQEFRLEGGPVFRALRQGDNHVLDDYATTNFDEFWAVCVETFFENPEEFRNEEPGLYQSICDLLNQDPTRPDKIIDKKTAGITEA
jgi:Mlc titration factor MtfA (ptsG expression regulator)